MSRKQNEPECDEQKIENVEATPYVSIREKFKKKKLTPFGPPCSGSVERMSMEEYEALLARKGAKKNVGAEKETLKPIDIVKINVKCLPVTEATGKALSDIGKKQTKNFTVMDHRVFRKMLSTVDSKLVDEVLDFFIPTHKDSTVTDRIDRLLMLKEFLEPEDPKTHVPFSIPRENFTDWVLRRDGEIFEVVRVKNSGSEDVLVSGPATVVLAWLSHYSPRTLKGVYEMCGRMLEDDEQMEELDDGIGNLLTEARNYRTLNKALDKYSKHSQLDFTEQDSDLMMFGVDDVFVPDVVVGDQCHHLTALFPDAVSLSYLSDDTGKYGFEDKNIAASVIIGDCIGATGNDQRLLSNLERLSKTNVVRVKLTLEPTCCVRGFVISKGRPHNKVVVIQLDDSDDPVWKIYKEYYGSIKEANDARNKRYRTLTVPDIKETRANYDFLSERVRNKRKVKFQAPKSLFKRRVGYLDHVKKTEVRQLAYTALCMDKYFKPKGSRYRLATDFMYKGAFKDLDLGVGPPLFSFESLYFWAVGNRYVELFFDDKKGWSTRQAKIYY